MAMKKGAKGKKHCDKACGVFAIIAVVLLAISQWFMEDEEKYIPGQCGCTSDTCLATGCTKDSDCPGSYCMSSPGNNPPFQCFGSPTILPDSTLYSGCCGYYGGEYFENVGGDCAWIVGDKKMELNTNDYNRDHKAKLWISTLHEDEKDGCTDSQTCEDASWGSMCEQFIKLVKGQTGNTILGPSPHCLNRREGLKRTEYVVDGCWDEGIHNGC